MAPSTLKSQQLFSDAVRPAHLSLGRNLIEEFLRDARVQPESAPALCSFLLVTLPDRFLLIEAADGLVHVIDDEDSISPTITRETEITSLRPWENEKKPVLHFARPHS